MVAGLGAVACACSCARANVQRGLFGAPAVQRAFADQPIHRIRLLRNLRPDIGDFLGQLDRPARRFTTPEGN